VPAAAPLPLPLPLLCLRRRSPAKLTAATSLRHAVRTLCAAAERALPLPVLWRRASRMPWLLDATVL
jgi:hypothetical protein